MNYANMIEEKNLKKGFIIATLLSTVIGTFTASMTLQDKISEKRAKKKQAKTDQSQDDQIKEMKEKLEKLSKGEDGNNNKKEEGKEERAKEESAKAKEPRSRSISSRSRSSSRRRPPRNLDDDAYLAANAARSKDMIERTYQDHLSRLGPKYARGDLTTENLLQAQVIQLQQTVIGVLQDALYNGRNLSEEDMRRLISAQNSARDGSIEALQGQYERMLALEKKSNGSAPDQVPVPRALPEPQPRETLADYGVPPQRRASSSQEAPRRDRDRERDFVPEAAMAAGVFGTTGLGIATRAPSRHGSPLPRSTRTALPQSRKDSGFVGADSQRDHDAPRAPKTEMNGGPRSTKTEVGGAAGKGGPEERPKSMMSERTKPGNGGDASKSVKSEGHKSTKTELNGPSKAAPQGDKDNAKSTKGDAPAKSTKTEAPKSRTGAPPPGKDARADATPPKEWYPPRKPRSQEAAPPSLPRAAPAKARSASPKRQVVHRPPRTHPKGLPETPAGDLFCRYSIDLQQSKLPLHPTFSGTGTHRCPACKFLVPVDVRDVWVISTNTTNNPSSKQASSKPHADYRMDARFIVKCHTAANQREEGGFACVLCDRYRDMDCICKSVDALVKHVGSAHGPEEYERDGDLHRMKKGGNVEINGREFVLA